MKLDLKRLQKILKKQAIIKSKKTMKRIIIFSVFTLMAFSINAQVSDATKVNKRSIETKSKPISKTTSKSSTKAKLPVPAPTQQDTVSDATRKNKVIPISRKPNQ